MTSTRKQNHIHALLEMDAPFIIWGIPPTGVNCCSVTGDNLNGGRIATEYLISLGKKRIAFLGGPSENWKSSSALKVMGCPARLETDH